MRINRIALENFRCFRQVGIDLSADVVAIYGRNGVGKTAIFDALEFALLGSIGRFDQESTGPPYYLPHVLSDDNGTIRVGFKGDTDDWVKLDIDRTNFNVHIESSGNWRSHSELLYDFFVSASCDVFYSGVLNPPVFTYHCVRVTLARQNICLWLLPRGAAELFHQK